MCFSKFGLTATRLDRTLIMMRGERPQPQQQPAPDAQQGAEAKLPEAEDREARTEAEAQRIYNVIERSGLAGEEMVKSYFRALDEVKAEAERVSGTEFSDQEVVGYIGKWMSRNIVDRLREHSMKMMEIGKADELYNYWVRQNFLGELFNPNAPIFNTTEKQGVPLQEYLSWSFEERGVEVEIEVGTTTLDEFYSQDELNQVLAQDYYELNKDIDDYILFVDYVDGKISGNDLTDDELKKILPFLDGRPHDFRETIPVITLRTDGKTERIPVLMKEVPGGYHSQAAFTETGLNKKEPEKMRPARALELYYNRGTILENIWSKMCSSIHEINHAVDRFVGVPDPRKKAQEKIYEMRRAGHSIDEALEEKRSLDPAVAQRARMLAEGLSEYKSAEFRYTQMPRETKMNQAFHRLDFLDDLINIPELDEDSRSYQDYMEYIVGGLMAQVLHGEDLQKFKRVYYERSPEVGGIDYTEVQKKLARKMAETRNAAYEKAMKLKAEQQAQQG